MPVWELEDDGQLAPLAKRMRRESQRSAKAAMRVRRAALLEEDQRGGALSGDAGARAHHADQLVALPRATAEDRERWAADGRRPSQWEGDGRGVADGSVAALWRVHELLLVCDACSGLVNGQAARAHAYAAGRLTFTGTDGCGSRSCSGNHRPGSYRAGQENMARGLLGLLKAQRQLIRWPASTAHTHAWVVGAEERREVAEHALRSSARSRESAGAAAAEPAAASEPSLQLSDFQVRLDHMRRNRRNRRRAAAAASEPCAAPGAAFASGPTVSEPAAASTPAATSPAITSLVVASLVVASPATT